MAWRCRFLDGRVIARNDLVKNCRVHPTHWLISTQLNAREANDARARRRDGLRRGGRLHGAVRCERRLEAWQGRGEARMGPEERRGAREQICERAPAAREPRVDERARQARVLVERVVDVQKIVAPVLVEAASCVESSFAPRAGR
jgi:hypothetical protein